MYYLITAANSATVLSGQILLTKKIFKINIIRLKNVMIISRDPMGCRIRLIMDAYRYEDGPEIFVKTKGMEFADRTQARNV